jgi:AraC-like DNA-binding protein
MPSAMGIMTRLACAHAQQQGADVGSLLRKAGLTPEEIADPTSRFDVQRQIEFLDLVAGSLQDDLLGFRLAQTYDLRMIGLLYYAQASSETMVEALQRVARYSSIINEGIALKLKVGRSLGIELDYVGVSRSSDKHQIEFAMVSLTRISRQLTGRPVAATRVGFMHPRNCGHDEFKGFFGSNVSFGASQDVLCFPASLGETSVVHADPYLNRLLTSYCEQALASREAPRSPFGLNVENAIAVSLPHGNAGAAEIAKRLGVSRRTLSRRLSSEGLTFAAVTKNLRRDLATRHLADQTLSISEIAWLLGYQDVSAFTHAYKRWTGSSPRKARHAKA